MSNRCGLLLTFISIVFSTRSYSASVNPIKTIHIQNGVDPHTTPLHLGRLILQIHYDNNLSPSQVHPTFQTNIQTNTKAKEDCHCTQNSESALQPISSNDHSKSSGFLFVPQLPGGFNIKVHIGHGRLSVGHQPHDCQSGHFGSDEYPSSYDSYQQQQFLGLPSYPQQNYPQQWYPQQPPQQFYPQHTYPQFPESQPSYPQQQPESQPSYPQQQPESQPSYPQQQPEPQQPSYPQKPEKHQPIEPASTTEADPSKAPEGETTPTSSSQPNEQDTATGDSSTPSANDIVGGIFGSEDDPSSSSSSTPPPLSVDNANGERSNNQNENNPTKEESGEGAIDIRFGDTPSTPARKSANSKTPQKA